MNDKCQPQEMPSKGVGVVAVDVIEAGELLLAELPLIIVPWWVRHSLYPSVEKKKILENALRDLSPNKRKEFWNLHDSKIDPGEEKTANGIFRTNNFALGGSGPKSNNGLFLEMSRFNHSCVPNADFHWNGRRQEIRAVRRIEPGTEVTICYFTNQTAVQNQVNRKAYLQQQYGFPCDCTACSLQGDLRKQDDFERAQIQLLEDRIERLLYDFPADYSLSENEDNDLNSKENNFAESCTKDCENRCDPKTINSSNSNENTNTNHSNQESDSNKFDEDIKSDSSNKYNHNSNKDIYSNNSKSDFNKNDYDDNRNNSNSNEDMDSDTLDEAEECVTQGLQLAFQRLALMEKLGFKAVSKIRVCNLIFDTALEWDMCELADRAGKTARNLSRILYGENSPKYMKIVQKTQDILDR